MAKKRGKKKKGRNKKYKSKSCYTRAGKRKQTATGRKRGRGKKNKFKGRRKMTYINRAKSLIHMGRMG